MSTHDCDQFAADALGVRGEICEEKGVKIDFNYLQIKEMVEEIEHLTAQGELSSDEITEAVLGKYNFLHAVEEEAYRRLLRRIFKRRLGARSSMHARNGKFAPFAPHDK